ncbi:hypothetical protein [Gracilimonas tropica]|uniref:hypothetical protein n=1 Tax=Gracilimonas tropica TaxID=454600 RepID=UPI0003810375|nr:hypothetical protein [Gracilimonas tropica]
MRPLQSILIFLLIYSCTKAEQQPSQKEGNIQKAEMVDVRIYPDGKIILNGEQTNFSALDGRVESMNIGDETRARFVFVTGEQTPLVYKTTRLIHQKGATRIKKIILEEEEFWEYINSTIHIDVLRSGKILFQGKELFVQDLPLALDRYSNKEMRFVITKMNDFEAETYQKAIANLDSLGFGAVITKGLSDYE